MTYQELLAVHEGIVNSHKLTPWYRFIRKHALAQRAYAVGVILDLVEERLMKQEGHSCEVVDDDSSNGRYN